MAKTKRGGVCPPLMLAAAAYWGVGRRSNWLQHGFATAGAGRAVAATVATGSTAQASLGPVGTLSSSSTAASLALVPAICGLGLGSQRALRSRRGFFGGGGGDAPAGTIYDYNVKNIDGGDVSLKDYEGKVVLIVNVASK
eukprot:TRINITY_DN12201_c1_g1_i1.p2 TRINITY_DN12201_c1_g1~~TRINITY_DN12201_c1_g1_i1.p2  ORF type:complete len:140 (+),score=41.19 TRINITY_DN12201_c1_g1_i1:101-520(+)